MILIAWKDNNRVSIVLDTRKPFMLDCRLNDSNIAVELYKAALSGQSKQKVNPQTDPSVTQNGHKFTIDVSTWTVGNNMEFECRAIGSGGNIVLEKQVTLKKPRGVNSQIELILFKN